MRSPAEMEVIQLEITNACPHSCSNCTRFCGHHQHSFFMDLSTFQRTVDSLKGYDGIIGMMGGEPLLHPEFELMTKYLRKKHGMSVNLKATRRPVNDFLTYTRAKHNANRVLNKCKGPGLWTSMPKQYYRYYELIQDSFVFQCLNDHYHPSIHQPLLVARKDLGIPDEQWFKLRDACWIQNNWSASITPKGAFFCEVAAALDMLFNGPGGWAIEPDWWKRRPSDFGDQLHWCEMCGAALDTKRRDANEQIDDVSPTLIQRLEAIHSPKLKKERVLEYPSKHRQSISACSEFRRHQYIDKFAHRLGTSNLNLLPKSVTAIIHWDTPKPFDESINYIKTKLRTFDAVALILESHLTGSNKIANDFVNEERLKVFKKDKNGFGEILDSILRTFPNADWFILFSGEQNFSNGISSDFKKRFMNPGVLYSFTLKKERQSDLQDSNKIKPHAEFFLFNHMADALRRTAKKDIIQCIDWNQFKNLWPEDKRLHFNGLPEALPETDEGEWMQVVDDEFINDREFCAEFKTVMTDHVPPNSNVLVTQSASYFLTRALIRILHTIHYNVYLVSHSKYAKYFRDILSPHHIFEFSQCEKIQFDCLKELCGKTNATVKFSGAVVPYSSPRRMIEPEDGYQDIEKVAVYLANQIVCGVNLKRQFVSGHKDHHRIYENRWGY